MAYVKLGTVGAALSLGCLAVNGCGNPEVYKEEPRDLAADAIAEALCEKVTPCCQSLGYGAPSDTCVSGMRNEVMLAIIAAENDRRDVRPEAIDACVERFEAAISDAAACPDVPGPADLLVLCPDLMTPIPEGTRQPGDSCSGTYDCASPSEPGERDCVAEMPGSGTCYWFLSRALGAGCDAEPGKIVECAVGLSCVPTPRGQAVCEAPPGYGDPCVLGDDTCQEGLQCADYGAGVFKCDVMMPEQNSFPDALAGTRTTLQALCR
jgi:hypothetical protein